MKEKIKKIIKNPFLKSILSSLFIVIGFSFVKFDGQTIIDGLISGVGMILFFISIFVFSFSVCETVSVVIEAEREKEREEEKEKEEKRKIS